MVKDFMVKVKGVYGVIVFGFRICEVEVFRNVFGSRGYLLEWGRICLLSR